MTLFCRPVRRVDSSGVTESLLAEAAAIPDLDEACVKLQSAMRVTDGGVAGHFFDWLSDGEWESAPIHKRTAALREYVKHEQAMSESF